MGDSTVRSLLAASVGRNRRNVAALVLVAGVVGLAVLVPHWITRYGAALAIFCIWMAWFVETLATWLADDAGVEEGRAGDTTDR